MSDNLSGDADKNADSVSELQAVARLAQRMRSYLYTITKHETKIKLARSLQAAAALPKFAQGPLISLYDYACAKQR